MDDVSSSIFDFIYDNLPLFSEEGAEYTVTKVTDLVPSDFEQRKEFILGVLELLQRLFTSFGLLDTTDLSEGKWRFVSRPASLLARSLVMTLKEADSPLFPVGFWLTHDSASPWSDEQRKILHEIELKRKLSLIHI